MRIAEQRRTRSGRLPGCEEDLQIKKTGSSGLEKKDRRYMADMDCGGGRHLPQEKAAQAWKRRTGGIWLIWTAGDAGICPQETPGMIIQSVPIMRGRGIRIC